MYKEPKPKSKPVPPADYTSGKGGLPTPAELEIDKPSALAFWPASNEMASGHNELAPNFSKPFLGKSRGQKRSS